MAAEDRRRLIASFIDESLAMLRRLHPCVRALVAQPDRGDLPAEVIGRGVCLFHFIEATAATLGFDHLAAPAAAMVSLLDRVRSGVVVLSPCRIALLAETCTFFEHGLTLALEEQSDGRLAGSAAGLASAVRLAASPEQEGFPTGNPGTGAVADAREAFFRDMVHLVAAAERECVLWHFIAVDPVRVAELSRLLHRLKQHFALHDFHDPERICQALAAMLIRCARGERLQTEYPERTLLRCLGALRSALAALPLTNDLVVPDVEQHLAAIQGLMHQPLGELLIEAGLVDPATIDQALEMQRSEPVGHARRLGEVLVAMGRLSPEQVAHALREQRDRRAQAPGPAAAGETGGETAPAMPSAVRTPPEDASDDHRLDRMHFVLEQLLAMGPPDEYLPLLGELRTIVDSCRRSALVSLAGRLQRMVHDLSRRSGKRVQCVVEGIETLRETGATAVLADALHHLLRNGVEHGLEPVEERTRSGKRATGRLHLLALCQGEEVWISVEDDGRGFDDGRVAALLIGRGLATADTIAGLTGRERISLLLREPPLPLPEAGQRDGGLVAVHRTVRGIGGTVHVTSRPARGACVTLRVPRRR
ncbi:ATP-binding protein [Desulfobulbus elongatus]|uniref:ATP-binding protein n=1 Tax=Desulfobulbus elongatus TaxID=53332 RepID=UPI000AF58C46|nr:ATP-binding protein [Desulfobulbus elongatus]